MATIRVNVNTGPYVNANIASYDVGSGEIIFLSLLGYSAAIKQIGKDINKRNQVLIGSRYFNSAFKAYEVIQTRSSDSDFAHTIIYKKDTVYKQENGVEHMLAYVFTQLDRGYVLGDEDIPQELLDGMYDKLYKHTPVPVLREWMPYIMRGLIANNTVTEPYVHKEDEDQFRVFRINMPFPLLSQLISQGLREREISIEGCAEVSEEVADVVGLDSYLNTFSEVLAGKIQSSFAPKFVPGQDEYSESLQDFADYASLRGKLNLYEAQKAAIQSASLNLDKNNVSFIIAEMGSGKTAMGIGTIMANAKSKKSLINAVLCPGHLVEKWKTEILRLAPLSEAIIVDNFNAFKRIEAKINDPHRRKHLWLIFSKETAKFGYDLRPAVIWSKGTGVRRQPCYVCPECGQPLYKVVTEGSGRNKWKHRVWLDEKDFAHKNAVNSKCINTVSYWDSEAHEQKERTCGANLWTPVIHEEEPKWVKLGDCGWIEHQHMGNVLERLTRLTKISREDAKLLGALSDAVTATHVQQRAPRKFPIAKYISRYYGGKIDYLIADEIHLYKAGESAQGEAFGDLVHAANKTIGLTGTLLNGYASGLFHILYRTFAHTMKKEGYDYNDHEAFARDYGVTRKTNRFEWSNGEQGARNGNGSVKALPGVSPIVFTKFLLENAAFVSLSDIADGLPNYTEIPMPIDMDPELASSYRRLEESIRQSFGGRRRTGGMKTMAQMLQSLSVYPDQPYGQPPIIHPENGTIVATPDELDTRSRTKEARFMSLIREKHAMGEKVLVYYHWTNRTNLGERLTNLLHEEGLSVAVLTSKVKARDREKWINDRLAEGIDVLICNPTLVETGLDLLDFTTIIYYQVGYNLFTMRQASRRSWRLGQERDIEVYFLYYRDTVQEQALSLMATKLQAAMSIEGKFSEEGLNAMSNNEDLLTQIANSVVEGIKHSVDVQVFQKTSIVSKREAEVEAKAAAQSATGKHGGNVYSFFSAKPKLSKKKRASLEEAQATAIELMRHPSMVANLF